MGYSVQAAFVLMGNRIVNIAVVTISLCIAFYFTEVVLAITGHDEDITQKRWRAAERLGLAFDTRTKHEVVLSMRSMGVDAWPALSPGKEFIYSDGVQSDDKGRLFPLSGISGKRTINCNESGEYSFYESDEHGFNNPRGLYDGGRIDIALVGDSFTVGACVAPGQDIASYLRRAGLQTISLAAGGNGPLSELATLKEYGSVLRPRVVLWMYDEKMT